MLCVCVCMWSCSRWGERTSSPRLPTPVFAFSSGLKHFWMSWIIEDTAKQSWLILPASPPHTPPSPPPSATLLLTAWQNVLDQHLPCRRADCCNRCTYFILLILCIYLFFDRKKSRWGWTEEWRSSHRGTCHHCAVSAAGEGAQSSQRAQDSGN